MQIVTNFCLWVHTFAKSLPRGRVERRGALTDKKRARGARIRVDQWLLVGVAALLAVLPSSSEESTRIITEQVRTMQRLEASFIVNFPFYVTWPKSIVDAHPNDFPIALIGDTSSLGQAGLSYITEREYDGRFFTVTDVTDTSAQNLSQYQIIYFGTLPKKEIKKILKVIKRKPILTISRQVDFLKEGGMIEMRDVTNSVTYRVNMPAARQAGLKVDDRLIVYGKVMTPLNQE